METIDQLRRCRTCIFLIFLCLLGGLNPSVLQATDEGGKEEPLADDPLEGEEDSFIANGDLKITFFPLSRGEAVLLQLTRSGTNLLINTGGPGSAKELQKGLDERGVYQLEALILTHSSPRQLTGLQQGLQGIDVDKVFLPQLVRYAFPISLFQEKGWEVVEVDAGTELRWENLVLTALTPVEPLSLSPQNHAMVLLGRYHAFRFLLTSEINEVVERKLVESHDLSGLNLMEVSDYGSNQASAREFLQEVDAETGVVFHDGDPLYSQHEEVMERLYESWMDMYALPRDGTVSILCNGRDYQVFTAGERKLREFQKRSHRLNNSNEGDGFIPSHKE